MDKPSIKSVQVSAILYHLIRLAVGGLFMVSGAIKITDLHSFAEIINAYAILPPEWCGMAAAGICLAELICGLGLIMDIKGSLSAVLGLLLMFVLVLSYAWIMGYDVDCGCFGPNDPETKAFASIRTALVRDGVMILSLFYCFIWRNRFGHYPRSLKLFIKGELNEVR